MRSVFFSLCLSLPLAASILIAHGGELRTGAAALDGGTADAPGVRRHIKPSDLPSAVATDPETSTGTSIRVVARPEGALPAVPKGFAVQIFASGFTQPRTLRIAPNGDVFLSESGTGRVLVFRADSDSTSAEPEVFVENLDRPYPDKTPQEIRKFEKSHGRGGAWGG
jgi:hypothetical protein